MIRNQLLLSRNIIKSEINIVRLIRNLNGDKNDYKIENRIRIPNRPINAKDYEYTGFQSYTDEFKYVEDILPVGMVPDPPKHDQYPTPSGWLPPNTDKAKNLPYAALRTRFHMYGIYPITREGGTRKLVKVKYIQGDIWVCLLIFINCLYLQLISCFKMKEIQ
jgi:hypothetical protein